MGGPSRGVEIVPLVLRGGGGSLEGCRDNTIGTKKGWWGGPLRGVEIVPMVLRGGGGSLEGCRDSTIGTKGWVGGCFAKNLRNGG